MQTFATNRQCDSHTPLTRWRSVGFEPPTCIPAHMCICRYAVVGKQGTNSGQIRRPGVDMWRWRHVRTRADVDKPGIVRTLFDGYLTAICGRFASHPEETISILYHRLQTRPRPRPHPRRGQAGEVIYTYNPSAVILEYFFSSVKFTLLIEPSIM